MYVRGPLGLFDILAENAFKVSVRIQSWCVVLKGRPLIFLPFFQITICDMLNLSK